MQRDDVAPLQQRVEISVLHPECRSPFRRRKWIVCQHLCPEAAIDLRGDAANLPRADQAHCLPVEVKPDEATERKIVFTHAIVGAVNLAIERQQQRDRMLGHGVRGIGRDADDRHAKRLGRDEVHVVEPGAAQRHQPHAGTVQLFQARGVESVVDENTDSLRAIDAGGGFTRETKFMELPADLLRAGSTGEVFPVVRLRVVKGDGVHGGQESIPGWRIRRDARRSVSIFPVPRPRRPCPPHRRDATRNCHRWERYGKVCSSPACR